MQPSTANKISSNPDKYPSRRPGQHAEVLPRLDPVVYSPDFAAAPLSSECIDQYRNNGFVVLEQLFSGQEIAVLQRELEQLRVDDRIKGLDETICEPDSNAVRSIFSVHTLSKLLGALATDTRLVLLAEYLLGDQVYMHQSRLNYKPGFRGKEFYWHSDFETWHVEDGMPAMRALSMSITLTENYSSNGPLMLIPGSHKEFLACEGETPAQNFRTSLKKQVYGVPDDANLQRLVASNGIYVFAGKPGSVCIFDCNTMHGSNSNISPFPRSNVFFVYNALSNKVTSPFSRQPPRPEYICARENITPVRARITRQDHAPEPLQVSSHLIPYETIQN